MSEDVQHPDAARAGAQTTRREGEPAAHRIGSSREEADGPRVVVGLSATPGIAEDIAKALAVDLPDRLERRYPDARWEVRIARGVVLQTPTEMPEALRSARDRLLEDDCDLVILLTDLPLRHGRRPLLSHASPVHGVAVISLPALGAVQLRSKARRALLDTIDGLLGARDDAADDAADVAADVAAARRGARRRVRELGTDVSSNRGGVAFRARVVTGNLHLLAGMVRANDPWRLALRLERALTATVAASVFAVVTQEIWLLADHMGGWRHTFVAVGSTTAVCATLVLGAELWERSSHRAAREQVLLFNAATVATLLIGIAALYTSVFVIALLGTTLLVPPSLLSDALGHPATLGDQVELAWLASSLETLAGALGAGLESDEAVRNAAYSHRHRRYATATEEGRERRDRATPTKGRR